MGQQPTGAEPETYSVVNQFVNPCNPEGHYQQTGPEIWRDLNGKVDIFAAGVGSGGSLQGIGKFLEEQRPGAKVVAVESENSASFSESRALRSESHAPRDNPGRDTRCADVLPTPIPART